MTVYIVDFQAFRDDCNSFVLKEVAITSLNSEKITHCIVKSPFHLEELSTKRKREAHWLVQNYHGISWNEGNVSAEQMIQLLVSTTQDANQILIKGVERAKFLRKLIGKPVFDLDEIKCPGVRYLTEQKSYFSCTFRNHSIDKILQKNYKCSVLAVHKLKKWYLEYLARPCNLTLSGQFREEKQICDSQDGYRTAETSPPNSYSLISRKCVCGRLFTQIENCITMLSNCKLG